MAGFAPRDDRGPIAPSGPDEGEIALSLVALLYKAASSATPAVRMVPGRSARILGGCGAVGDIARSHLQLPEPILLVAACLARALHVLLIVHEVLVVHGLPKTSDQSAPCKPKMDGCALKSQKARRMHFLQAHLLTKGGLCDAVSQNWRQERKLRLLPVLAALGVSGQPPSPDSLCRSCTWSNQHTSVRAERDRRAASDLSASHSQG